LSFLAKNEALLLVHRGMSDISSVKRYDLMLTPQFYILKKEPLPVKYAYQAIKLAPPILDELKDIGEYRYAVFKEKESWSLIAYDMNKIELFLEERGLPKNLIGKIYFVQQVKEYFEQPVSIDDKNTIITVNDTVVMLPKSMVDSEKYDIFTDKYRPDKGISSIQNGNILITKKQAVIFSLLLIFLAVEYMIEGIRYRKATTGIEAKIERIKSRYPQLQGKSSMVLNNLYTTNYAIDNVQRKIRDRLKDISRLTSKKSKIKSLKITSKGYEVTIETDKKYLEELKKYAESNHLSIESTKNNLKLKGVL